VQLQRISNPSLSSYGFAIHKYLIVVIEKCNEYLFMVDYKSTAPVQIIINPSRPGSWKSFTAGLSFPFL